MSQYGAYGYAEHGAGYRADPRPLLHGHRARDAGPGAPCACCCRPSTTVAHFSRREPAPAAAALDPAQDLRRPRRRARQHGRPALAQGSPAGTRDRAAGRQRRHGAHRARRLRAQRRDQRRATAARSSSRPVRSRGVPGRQRPVAGGLRAGRRARASRPPSWPTEALKAQAVAARTYAVTTSKGGAGFDQYPDTRSQVYGGVAVETPATDAAVAATRGPGRHLPGPPGRHVLLLHLGRPHRGRREHAARAPSRMPWLKSVDDPYDSVSPRHRWGADTRDAVGAGAQAARARQGLASRASRCVKRGVSPRIVLAEVVGSRGAHAVDGATLRARLGLFDTWAYFTSISAERRRPSRRSLAARAGPSPAA